MAIPPGVGDDPIPCTFLCGCIIHATELAIFGLLLVLNPMLQFNPSMMRTMWLAYLLAPSWGVLTSLYDVRTVYCTIRSTSTFPGCFLLPSSSYVARFELNYLRHLLCGLYLPRPSTTPSSRPSITLDLTKPLCFSWHLSSVSPSFEPSPLSSTPCVSVLCCVG